MNQTLSSPDANLSLRFATADDAGLLLDFIRQLAEFEKLRHEVVADEAALCESLFGERRVAEVILAFWDDEPAGFALFFHNYSTFLARAGLYLEDLFVVPALRGRGIGQILLRTLARIAVKRGCGRFEWSVLDWNVDAIRFYERLGAKPMTGWTTYRVTGEALDELAKVTETSERSNV
jgi:GNAT superfamily N-acetyltransferase